MLLSASIGSCVVLAGCIVIGVGRGSIIVALLAVIVRLLIVSIAIVVIAVASTIAGIATVPHVGRRWGQSPVIAPIVFFTSVGHHRPFVLIVVHHRYRSSSPSPPSAWGWIWR